MARGGGGMAAMNGKKRASSQPLRVYVPLLQPQRRDSSIRKLWSGAPVDTDGQCECVYVCVCTRVWI